MENEYHDLFLASMGLTVALAEVRTACEVLLHRCQDITWRLEKLQQKQGVIQDVSGRVFQRED